MKSILVTGATGFIGRHILAPLAKDNNKIHALYSSTQPFLSYPNVVWHKINLLDQQAVKNLLQEIKPSHLLHLAWYAKPQEYWTSSNNIEWLYSSINLLNSFRNAGGKRAVLVGTCAEYDWQHGHCCEYETPCIPQTLYGRSKYALYLLSETIAKQEQISLAWARPFFIFGEHEYAQRIIPAAISSFLNKRIFDVMNANWVRDFMYAADVANALVALLDSDITGPVNIASGKPVSIREFISLIADKLQATQYINYRTLENTTGNANLVTADVERLFAEVKWQPKYSLDAAIDSTISWWSKRI